MIPPAGQNPDEDRQVERVPPPRRVEAEAPLVPEAMAPGAPASVFRPIRPEDRARAGVAAMPAPGRNEVPATPSVSPFREPPPLPGPPTAADPKTASAQQIASGKDALRAHQYSRAERSFLRATEKFPDPLAYFLLAQARFALGKYAEAVAAIHAGMRLRPDYPNAPFHARELYGANAADFPEQLQRLLDALAEFPDDPFLTFLYAHQLWFDNRRDEARLIFRRAQALAPEPIFCERFLQAKASSSI
jgi:tetratricopeptide (TPR) repeat protein